MQSVILKDSQEWAQLLRNLNWSKQKSNRDVLCLKCWKIMKYEECVKHKMLQPDHIKSILTSKEYAQEGKFIAVARALGKVRIEESSHHEYYENPYKTKDRRGRPPAHISVFNDEFRRQKEIEGGFNILGNGMYRVTSNYSGLPINDMRTNLNYNIQQSGSAIIQPNINQTKYSSIPVQSHMEKSHQMMDQYNNHDKQLFQGYHTNPSAPTIQYINDTNSVVPPNLQSSMLVTGLNEIAGQQQFINQNLDDRHLHFQSSQIQSISEFQQKNQSHNQQKEIILNQNSGQEEIKFNGQVSSVSNYDLKSRESMGNLDHQQEISQKKQLLNQNQIEILENQVDHLATQLSLIRKNQTLPNKSIFPNSSLKLDNFTGQLVASQQVEPSDYTSQGFLKQKINGQVPDTYLKTQQINNAQYQSLNQSSPIIVISNHTRQTNLQGSGLPPTALEKEAAQFLQARTSNSVVGGSGSANQLYQVVMVGSQNHHQGQQQAEKIQISGQTLFNNQVAQGQTIYQNISLNGQFAPQGPYQEVLFPSSTFPSMQPEINRHYQPGYSITGGGQIISSYLEDQIQKQKAPPVMAQQPYNYCIADTLQASRSSTQNNQKCNQLSIQQKGNYSSNINFNQGIEAQDQQRMNLYQSAINSSKLLNGGSVTVIPYLKQEGENQQKMTQQYSQANISTYNAPQRPQLQQNLSYFTNQSFVNYNAIPQ